MAQGNFRVNTLTIENETKLIDLRSGFVSIDYYEDVTSPTVIVDLVVSDGDGLIASLPLTGAESVSLEIEAIYSNQEKISFTKNDSKLCVVQASVLPGQSSNLYSLRLMSPEILANETTRVVKRYDAKVSEIVSKILTDNDLIGTKKQKTIEPTTNSYSFIGCYKRPFDIINWLCPKSVPSDDTAGFLFFETRKGYYFCSIDKKFQDKKSIELIQSTTPLSSSDPKYYTSFVNIAITENNDVLKSLRLGTYAHNSIFLNAWTMDYKVVTTKLSEKYGSDIKPSNSRAKTFKLNGLQDYPSRLIYRILDPGVMDKDGEKIDEQQLAKYQANAYMRYNLLFSSTTQVTLPLNISICAGDVVSLQMAKGQRGNPTSKVDENLKNQRYIVSKIRHSIQGDNNFSSLELVSDSYSVSSK